MNNKAKRLVHRAIDTAVSVSSSEVEDFIRAARRQRPGMSNHALLKTLERSYFGLVTTSGAAVGGAAALPGAGQVAASVLAVADAGAFTTATAIYVFSVASVHGIDVDDIERRKALLLSILAGPQGAAVVRKIAGRTGGHWGRKLTQAVPVTTVRQINKVLGPNFVTKYGTKQGILVIGKAAPFGIGAAIGATGNGMMAQAAIKATRSAFGPLPPKSGSRRRSASSAPSGTEAAAA